VQPPLRRVPRWLRAAGRSGPAARVDHWHARLLAAELLRRARRPGAEAQLTALARDARAEGFEMYARRAESALAQK